MTERFIADESDRALLLRFLMEHKLPLTINITKGDHRSLAQNRLQRLWMNEIAQQGDDNQTPEEVRGYCKLHHGVPIMRAENPKFRQLYDRLLKKQSYEDKLLAMQVPFDLPVTRQFSTEQMNRYLDLIHQEFTSKGFVLTNPEERLYEAMLATRTKVAA